MAVEEEFGIREVSNEEAQRIFTVDDMIRYLMLCPREKA